MTKPSFPSVSHGLARPTQLVLLSATVLLTTALAHPGPHEEVAGSGLELVSHVFLSPLHIGPALVLLLLVLCWKAAKRQHN